MKKKYETQLNTHRELIEIQSNNAIRVMTMVETWTAILGTVLLLAGIISLGLIKRSKESMYHEVKNQIVEYAKKEFDSSTFVAQRLSEYFKSDDGKSVLDAIERKLFIDVNNNSMKLNLDTKAQAEEFKLLFPQQKASHEGEKNDN
ncbi:hypothetical protein B4O99_10760 [Shewanella xiamenensis]|uniref:hypothetical protein n=1 Tax=Shewanella xiamenensis TaxID=332186 RepID=UPI001C4EE4B4|nr:hypothetical protein [Shewanella xiamenensis]MBW0280005.1 hypothetical protein [Shewanella xiamenensis]